MKDYVVFGILASLSVMAHELFPRHDGPLIAQAALWMAWFSVMYNMFRNVERTAILSSKEAIKHILMQTPVVIGGIFIVVFHIAMQLGPMFEIGSALAYLLVAAYDAVE